MSAEDAFVQQVYMFLDKQLLTDQAVDSHNLKQYTVVPVKAYVKVSRLIFHPLPFVLFQSELMWKSGFCTKGKQALWF